MHQKEILIILFILVSNHNLQTQPKCTVTDCTPETPISLPQLSGVSLGVQCVLPEAVTTC